MSFLLKLDVILLDIALGRTKPWAAKQHIMSLLEAEIKRVQEKEPDSNGRYNACNELLESLRKGE